MKTLGTHQLPDDMWLCETGARTTDFRGGITARQDADYWAAHMLAQDFIQSRNPDLIKTGLASGDLTTEVVFMTSLLRSKDSAVIATIIADERIRQWIKVNKIAWTGDIYAEVALAREYVDYVTANP